MNPEENKPEVTAVKPEEEKKSWFGDNEKAVLLDSIMTVAPALIGFAAGGQSGAAIGSKVSADMQAAKKGQAEKYAEQLQKQQEYGLKEKEVGLKEQEILAERKYKQEKLAFEKADAASKIDVEREKLAGKQEPKDTASRIAKLTSSDKARLDNSRMGLKAITAMTNALGSGQNTFTFFGDNDFTMNRRMFEEAIGRMQSGGAINDDEAKRFRALVPTALDDAGTQKKKLALMQDEMRQRFNTLGFSPEEIMGADDGGGGSIANTPPSRISESFGPTNATAAPKKDYSKMTVEELLELKKQRSSGKR